MWSNHVMAEPRRTVLSCTYVCTSHVGLSLWRSIMRLSVTYYPFFHKLFPSIRRVLQFSLEHIFAATGLIKSFVLLGGAAFLKEHAGALQLNCCSFLIFLKDIFVQHPTRRIVKRVAWCVHCLQGSCRPSWRWCRRSLATATWTRRCHPAWTSWQRCSLASAAL